MNRFTSHTLSIFSQISKRTSLLSTIRPSKLKIQYLFTSAKLRAQFNQKLLSGKYYQVLGFTKGTDINALTDAQIKRQYLSMVKKYHSDNVVDPSQKRQSQQITKCIISAYDKITTDRIQQQINRGVYDKIYQDEDQIAMKIYGKKFNDIKYDLFRQGNHAQRAEFMEELEKIRKQSKNYSHGHAQAQKNYYRNGSSDGNGTANIKVQFSDELIKMAIPVLAIFGAIVYYFMQKAHESEKQLKAQRSKTKMTLTNQQIRQIQRKSTQLHDKKLSDLINSYVDQQPPSLKYPSKEDPHQLEQLIQFSIAPDINLYQIDSKIMSQRKNLETLKQSKKENELKQAFGETYNPFELKNIKINSFLTLSLEAQRCLQNIYIKVKDVADEIEQTGKYTPPKIFFRYYGYCMFEIRDKPLSLSNYRDTEYVSLFDLFFDYYSPIPLKRHEYNEYVVGLNDQDGKMYGQVHLNHRKLPQRYITKEDKIVVMKDEIPSVHEQKKYEQIWQNFYKKYQKIWLRGYADRISNYHA